MANLELEKYIADARQRGMSDDLIRQELLRAGWNPADVDGAFNLRPVAPLVPTIAQSSASATNKGSAPTKRHHYLGPAIFFIVALGMNIFVGYQQGALWTSKTFVIGMFVIVLLLTGIFAFFSYLIRKICKRFGMVWAILSWVFLSLIPVGAVGYIFLQQNQPSPNVKAFQEKDFYQSPPQDWKTYINEPFDLSLKYPSTMKLSESPSAFGFDDVFGVGLEQSISSSTGISVSIFATTDNKKCDDLLVNASNLPKTFYSHKKRINGTEFSLASAPLWTASGPIIQVFGYFQPSPICKVSVVAYTTTDLSTYRPNEKIEVKSLQQARDIMSDTAKGVLSKIDYVSTLQMGESIIGSMSLDIKDTGSNDTTRMNESESVAGDQMTRIAGARGAAFRVYNYNPDNTKKSTPSYVGTCEDVAFKSLNPDMACRASKDAFIMYYKWNDKYGYVCGDAVSYGFVTIEPKGLYCGGNVSAAPTATVIKGTSVNGRYSHVGVSKTAAINDCGILAYKDNKEQSEGIGASSCINQAISACQPAVISGVVNGFISTYQVLGREGGQCVLTQRFFKQVSDAETQSAFQKCVIDPAVGWPSVSSCVDAE